MYTHTRAPVCDHYGWQYQAMSSACSTSYNIHEAQHLIPACPFKGCRYPVVADGLFLWLSWRQHQTIYSPLRSTHMHARAHTLPLPANAHALRAGHAGCHGYIKAETANFDQLLTVIESETVEIQYREMVKQGLSLTSTPYFNWQPRHRRLPSTVAQPVFTGSRVRPSAGVRCRT